MTIENLLDKYKLNNKKLKNIAYHIGLYNKDVDDFLTKLSKTGLISIADLEEKDKCNLIVELINRCDMSSEEYNKELDEEMTRIGNRTDIYFVRKSNRFGDNIYDANISLDSSKIYDMYIDRESGEGMKRK